MSFKSFDLSISKTFNFYKIIVIWNNQDSPGEHGVHKCRRVTRQSVCLFPPHQQGVLGERVSVQIQCFPRGSIVILVNTQVLLRLIKSWKYSTTHRPLSNSQLNSYRTQISKRSFQFECQFRPMGATSKNTQRKQCISECRIVCPWVRRLRYP